MDEIFPEIVISTALDVAVFYVFIVICEMNLEGRFCIALEFLILN